MVGLAMRFGFVRVKHPRRRKKGEAGRRNRTHSRKLKEMIADVGPELGLPNGGKVDTAGTAENTIELQIAGTTLQPNHGL